MTHPRRTLYGVEEIAAIYGVDPLWIHALANERKLEHWTPPARHGQVVRLFGIIDVEDAIVRCSPLITLTDTHSSGEDND